VRDSDFLSVVSHELRSPITVIIGLAGTLSERRHNLTEDEIDECLDQIRHQGERMAELVADLLDLSQLEAGRFRINLTGVQLVRAVTLALEAAPAPSTKTVDVAVPADIWVVADSGRLEQVLMNLLTNAYRYGGQTILVEGHCVDDQLLLTISDDGVGVPAELVPDLFDKYSRGEHIRDGGAGLGLSIVRALVEAFGGHVWYESSESGGARFNLALPLAGRDQTARSGLMSQRATRTSG
jgi:signal transduction histidine kinase